MYLVDTNVVSELPRPKPNPGALEWLGGQPGIVISVLTVEELTYGVERARGREQRRLRAWLDGLFGTAPTIVAIDERIARAAGELRAARERRGRTVAQADMLIAATALITGRVLVTRNTKDFTSCGVGLLNPFR
jgi:hypothetical protein